MARFVFATATALLLTAVHAQGPTSATTMPLACGDEPDVDAYCMAECPETLVDTKCDAYGVHCFCKNGTGEIEDTNVDAPLPCGTTTLEDACKAECKSLNFVDDQSCDNDEPTCECAPDDGVKNRGDDAPSEDLDYADMKDEEAKLREEELAEIAVPLVADAIEAVNTPSEGASSAVAVGGSILAVAAALVLA